MKKIGWIGTGVMGKSMCNHLLSKGYQLQVFNRTKSKTDELIQKGAKFADPVEIAKSVDIMFLMLGYPKDIEDILFEKEKIIELLKPGSILIDHTTSSPALAKKIYEETKKRNVFSLDAPVTGGDIGAKEGKLTIMVGGDKESFEKALEPMNSYAKNVQFLGVAGNGQHAKMANQIAIAGCMIGVVESLLYSYKAGLDAEHVLQTIGQGAAGSFSLNVYGPRILKRDFQPGFYVEHFVKDMEIALREASAMNLSLPGLSLVKELYIALKAQEGSKLGTQALMLVLEKLNNTSLEKLNK